MPAIGWCTSPTAIRPGPIEDSRSVRAWLAYHSSSSKHDDPHRRDRAGRTPRVLRAKGAIFVDELTEVPDAATVIFSAHGISPAVREESRRRGLRVIDATCPLVTKVHLEAIRYARESYSIILIGHEDHDEVIGTLGEAPDRIVVIDSVEEVDRLEVRDPEKIAYLTQTTLSVDDTRDVIEALRRNFPRIVGPSRDDI